MGATLDVIFKNGTGGLIATLHSFEKSDIVQSISTTGKISFPSAADGDTISITIACTGTANLTVTPPTRPATSATYPAGKFDDIYLL
jgi:hypothetical protein